MYFLTYKNGEDTTAVLPYPQFDVPQFQLPGVNRSPEAGDSPFDILSGQVET